MNKQGYIKLVYSSSIEPADDASIDIKTKDKQMPPKASKSNLVEKFSSFADDIDKQIEMILMS